MGKRSDPYGQRWWHPDTRLISPKLHPNDREGRAFARPSYLIDVLIPLSDSFHCVDNLISQSDCITLADENDAVESIGDNEYRSLC